MHLQWLSKGVPPAHAPLHSNILLISWSFLEMLTKSYVGAPLEGQHPSHRESWMRPWLVNTSVNYWIIHPKRINV